MLDLITPITESYSSDNFSMKEKTPIAKINLRGNLKNIEFTTNAERILGMSLPKEVSNTSVKENRN